MAAGDTILPAAQSRANYAAQNAKLIGEAFSASLDVASSNSDILSQLQGTADSGKPFVIKDDLTKGAGDTVNYTVGETLGQAGRRGTDRAVNYEETPQQNSFAVTIDNLRVVLGWSELYKWAAANGMSWQAAYPILVGKRVGQIEQEDMLMKLRQRSNSQNTVRPGGRATLDALRYGDTLDTSALGVAYSVLTSNGADPATIGTMTGGMPLNRYVSLGANFAFTGLWQDPTFTSALLHAGVDGPTNPYWTGDLPDWNGLVLKRWNIVNHSNPGPIGSSVIPEALLGDAITSGTGTFTVYGGGRSQATLGDANVLFKPFEYFYGCDKLFGQTMSMSTGLAADTNVYYFVVIDPADLKWCLYSYTGAAAFGANGHDITITARLASSVTGSTAVTTLGNVTWDSSVNKAAFPTGSRIVQCNAYGVPVCDVYLFGSNAGAKCYGNVRNKRIQNDGDYGALQGVGIWTIYGCETAVDSLGQYHKRFVRLQTAYTHPLGASLPQL